MLHCKVASGAEAAMYGSTSARRHSIVPASLLHMLHIPSGRPVSEPLSRSNATALGNLQRQGPCVVQRSLGSSGAVQWSPGSAAAAHEKRPLPLPGER